MTGFDRAALMDGLQRLGLTHMLQVAEHRAEEAAATSAGYLEFLHRLVEEELAVRFERYVEARTRLANFPFRKTLEQFDFDAQPGVDKRAIMDLASMAFVERATNVVLLGPPGVGKTHLAVGLGMEAIRRGYSVYFIRLEDMMQKLIQAYKEGRFAHRLRIYLKPKLLICDEIGYTQLDQLGSHLFFELVSKRYEKGAMILTSNKSYGAWGEIFDDHVRAAAILDRLLHHSITINIRGESYRLREKLKAGVLGNFAPPTPVQKKD